MKEAFVRTTNKLPSPLRWIVPWLIIVVVGALIIYDVTRVEPQPTATTKMHATTAATTTNTTTPVGALSENVESVRKALDRAFGPLPVASAPKAISHRSVRGVYIRTGQNLEPILALAKAGYINAVVLDFKESQGLTYKSDAPDLKDLPSSGLNLKPTIQALKEAGVIVIGRIVCFNDPVMAKAHPELAIRDEAGHVLTFSGEGQHAFLNPYNTRTWDYLIAISKDVIAMGVDEIQYDYVRFPTGRATNGGDPFFGHDANLPSKTQAINRFLETARVSISQELGVPIGVDVFSIIITNESDGKRLGQDWFKIGLTGVDSISPMVYPSHYANAHPSHYTGNGQGTYIGNRLFAKPDLEPYDVTRLVLLQARVAELSGRYAHVRPYLQAFTASYLPEGYYMTYDAKAIAATIAGAHAAGYDEWILWDPACTYAKAIFTDKALQVPPNTDARPAAP